MFECFATSKGSEAFLVRTLARPDPQFLALCFAAATIKDLGAARLQLIARYVAYMRQGGIFIRGEALTSQRFAGMLQRHFEGLITIDPHLHSHATLDEVYEISSVSVRSPDASGRPQTA